MSGPAGRGATGAAVQDACDAVNEAITRGEAEVFYPPEDAADSYSDDDAD